MLNKSEQLRSDSWSKSLNALGTSYIFQEKVKVYKRLIRLITVFGIAAPLLLGATLAAYGGNSIVLIIAVTITAPITIAQVLLSAVSLVYKWDEQLAYSLESLTDNRVISEQYEEIAKFPPTSLLEHETKYSLLKARDDFRTAQDEKIVFTSKENCKGMRYALWIRKKECATCKLIPINMSPTECQTCGKF
ncbi:mobilome CxxCx(11)CxxC protein [Pedobacter sp. WC2423]|uniref:mobilome CxxCx(11)CxxC protein n=1 Tax=Pedobacter sp. WC2423 TaxID=3234142 RepID=UPI00346573C2